MEHGGASSVTNLSGQLREAAFFSLFFTLLLRRRRRLLVHSTGWFKIPKVRIIPLAVQKRSLCIALLPKHCWPPRSACRKFGDLQSIFRGTKDDATKSHISSVLPHLKLFQRIVSSFWAISSGLTLLFLVTLADDDVKVRFRFWWWKRTFSGKEMYAARQGSNDHCSDTFMLRCRLAWPEQS